MVASNSTVTSASRRHKRLDGTERGTIITTAIIGPALAVFVGANLQRISGIGFSLIAAPLLVLVLGPYEGVVLANMLAFMVSGATLASVWRDVDGKRASVLVPAGLLGVVPGVIVARTVSTDLLQVLVGTLILAGMVLVTFTTRVRFDAVPGAHLAAGLASGFMTATASVGGPALTVYAVATRWSQRRFAATAQVSFVCQGALALALKGLPELGLGNMAVLVAMVIAGLASGHLLADAIGSTLARRVVTWLALLGAAGTVVKGLVGLLRA